MYLDIRLPNARIEVPKTSVTEAIRRLVSVNNTLKCVKAGDRCIPFPELTHASLPTNSMRKMPFGTKWVLGGPARRVTRGK